MPRPQKKAVLASSALSQRWANQDNLFPSLSTADTATQTEISEKKSHGTQTETESFETNCEDIGTADESVAFAAEINQQLAAFESQICKKCNFAWRQKHKLNPESWNLN